MSFQSPNGVTSQAANVRHLDVRQKTVSATVARKKAYAYATAAYTYFRETVDDTVFCRTHQDGEQEQQVSLTTSFQI